MEHSTTLPKLVVIVGPTASGKTSWGLEIAKQFHGEIISADSRQIYQKMTIGTAKVRGEWRWNGFRRTYFVEDIPHHLVDFLNPGKTFSAAEFRDKALKYCKLAQQAGRLPMVVGGTGLYVTALVDNFTIPRVEANPKLRLSLEEKDHIELVQLLKTFDPVSAARIDVKNKRRLIRALEVCIMSGESFSRQRKKGVPLFDILQIGIAVPREVLYTRINERIDEMIAEGLLAEIEALVKQKYGWHLPSMNGIGYRQFKDYFANAITLPEAVELLKRDTRHYARKQMTWFRRDPRIKWCETLDEARRLTDDFLHAPPNLFTVDPYDD